MNRHTLDLEHKTHLKKILDSRQSGLESVKEDVRKMESDMVVPILSNCSVNDTDGGRSERVDQVQKSDSLDYHLRTGNTLLSTMIAEGTTLEGEGIKQVEPKTPS
jgi:hypothetical protein